MYKEMQVILVNKVMYLTRICNWKKEGRGGGEAQGVADPPPKKNRFPRNSEESSAEFDFWHENFPLQNATRN
jgi:hypothetical protein